MAASSPSKWTRADQRQPRTARDQGLHTGHRRVPHLAHERVDRPGATSAGSRPGPAWTAPRRSRGRRTPRRSRSTGRTRPDDRRAPARHHRQRGQPDRRQPARRHRGSRKRHGPAPMSVPPDYISQCVTDSIMSPDGSSIVCGYDDGQRGNPRLLPTGRRRDSSGTRPRPGSRRSSTAYRTFNGQAEGQCFDLVDQRDREDPDRGNPDPQRNPRRRDQRPDVHAAARDGRPGRGRLVAATLSHGCTCS